MPAAAGQSPRLHASFHVIVENRLATGDEPVVRAYERLRAAGLDRHTTIHALASAVTKQIQRLLDDKREYTADDDRVFDTIDPAAWRAPQPVRRGFVPMSKKRRKKK